MDNSTIQLNGIYKLATKVADGITHIQVISIKGNQIEGALGRFTHGDFFLRTHHVSGRPVRVMEFSADLLAAFVQLGSENIMSKKDAANNDAAQEGAEDLTYVPEGEEPQEATSNDGTTGAAVSSDAKSKINAIKKAAAEKIKAEEAKQKAKDNAAIDRRAKKLKDAATKAGIKEADAATRYTDGRATTFKAMDEAETTKALEGLATEAKAKKEADRELDKNAKKLRAGVEKLGVKEADVAAEFGGEGVKKFDALTTEQAKTALEAVTQRVKDKGKSDKVALRTQLTDEEAVELKAAEKTVEKNLDNFQTAAMQIGGALTIINRKSLFRSYVMTNGEVVKTFAEYVQERFGLSRPHAYSVMAAAESFNALTEGNFVDVKSLPSITAAESIHRGVKGLLKEANLTDSPEVDSIIRQLSRNVYQVAVQNAPKDKDGNPILSPGHIASTFEVLNEVAKTGAVEIDGKQVPINVAAASMDEMITTTSKERVERMKAELANRIQAREEAAKAGNAGGGNRLEAAINSVTGNGQALPSDVTPRLTVICSFHGKNTVEETSDLDLTLACNCVFINTPEGYAFDKKTTDKRNAAAAKKAAKTAPATEEAAS